MDIAELEGEEGKIAFNSRYLIDVLSVLERGRVAIETTTSSSPGVFKPTGQRRLRPRSDANVRSVVNNDGSSWPVTSTLLGPATKRTPNIRMSRCIPSLSRVSSVLGVL